MFLFLEFPNWVNLLFLFFIDSCNRLEIAFRDLSLNILQMFMDGHILYMYICKCIWQNDSTFQEKKNNEVFCLFLILGTWGQNISVSSHFYPFNIIPRQRQRTGRAAGCGFIWNQLPIAKSVVVKSIFSGFQGAWIKIPAVLLPTA